MANRLARFSKPVGSNADHLSILKNDYDRMETRATKLRAERDKLVEALRDEVIQKRMLARNALDKEVAAYAAQDCERAEDLLRELGEPA